jgi:clan AA aspartic protease
MISGIVNEKREAIITLAIYGNKEQKLISLKATIDTGFTGDLILPKKTILQLGLSVLGRQDTTLGDGTITQVSMYHGVIIWDGSKKSIDVCSAKNGILVGMGLLDGYRLELEAIPNGIVNIIKIQVNESDESPQRTPKETKQT